MQHIILDCDPGHDDAMAILLAVGNPGIDLIGVTTVGGNQSLDKVTYNARSVLEMAHATDIPVHAGSDRPLIRPLEVAASIHGETGLDGVTLPKPTRPLEQGHAANWIIDTIMGSEPGTITLVPTGPLTNIALAARLEPRIVERVKEVVLMGGGVHVGNWSAVAEFNIKTDPEAARVVFREAWPLTMVGLDLTHQALCTPQVQSRIDAIGTDLSAFASGLMDFFRKSYQNNQDFIDPPVHDPCTVAYLIDPSVMTTRRCPLDVEIADGPTLGMTVADLRGPEPSAKDCHTQVALKLDFDKFWNLIIDAITRIG
ncbi:MULTISPECIES: nucleoside hydrolase [Bifidobacterium]|jgi:purine nucleosidase|uniref:Nucleoside hydrolase n=1 Tax=Bifidobacterium tibiigranuli TaxID=2172043 RepID=A0A5N6RZR7_9BIFI|nr:nucleoside hydrolase [Bifidobacterium tibiigranuli]KAE8127499.1 nucleoside hydrolase [Bifidobacterium tibiigranuli]KAE8127946.1 ribonucleoside hydrolase [Bifidobacterium tibiigranuli]MCH3975115.1 nucleoside hydrolase [Bifidobacterium tibiigranuli]MCH4190311.1 nucleoside hydrolase [Bifidobacterium tibiigranuli]MCH4202873.1 nucleoside hydrolase [Bifidobacterium tibiigranuli]